MSCLAVFLASCFGRFCAPGSSSRSSLDPIDRPDIAVLGVDGPELGDVSKLRGETVRGDCGDCVDDVVVGVVTGVFSGDSNACGLRMFSLGFCTQILLTSWSSCFLVLCSRVLSCFPCLSTPIPASLSASSLPRIWTCDGTWTHDSKPFHRCVCSYVLIHRSLFLIGCLFFCLHPLLNQPLIHSVTPLKRYSESVHISRLSSTLCLSSTVIAAIISALLLVWGVPSSFSAKFLPSPSPYHAPKPARSSP
jgi:hypothetical protein